MKYADGTAERNPCKFYPSKKQVKMYQSKRHTKSRSGFINNDRIFLLSLLLYYPYFTFANQKHTQAKYPLIISICCVISVNHTKEYLYIFEISSAYFFFLSFSLAGFVCSCVCDRLATNIYIFVDDAIVFCKTRITDVFPYIGYLKMH